MHLTYTRDRMHLVIAYSAEQAYRLVIEGDGFGLAHIFGGQAEIEHDDTGAHLLIHQESAETSRCTGRAAARRILSKQLPVFLLAPSTFAKSTCCTRI